LRFEAPGIGGCGIFITINHAIGDRRRADDVDRIRKHFVEIDGTMTLDAILA
jgi:hypothetical protein